MGKHSKISPSSAKKWLNCSACIGMEAHVPNQISIFAREGTIAHEIAELKVKKALNRITELEYRTLKSNIFEVDVYLDEDMENYTDDFVDYVLESCSAHGEDFLIQTEMRVNISRVNKHCFGTVDISIISDDIVEIIDFKYGKGVIVDAYNNPQMLLYAIGVLDEYSFIYEPKKVKCTIYQPRLWNISSYEVDTCLLMSEKLEEYKECAELALSHKGEPEAGTWCKEGFCNARPFCNSYAEYLMDIEYFKDLEAHLLPQSSINEILLKADELIKWLKDVKGYALTEMLENRLTLGDFKVVKSRSTRKFKSNKEDYIVDKICSNSDMTIDDLYARKLIALTSIEKKLGKTKFNELLGDCISKDTGSPTVANRKDKRKEYIRKESDVFDSLIQNGDDELSNLPF